MIEEIKITTEKDTNEYYKNYELIYDKTILCLDNAKSIDLHLKDDDTPLFFKFVFLVDGHNYQSYWDRYFIINNKHIYPDICGIKMKDAYESNIDLIYFLNKQQVYSCVKLSSVNYYKNQNLYGVMIKNQFIENSNERLFYFSLWRLI